MTSEIGRLEAVAAEHDLEVEIQHVPLGVSRGWYAAIYGDTACGIGGGRTVEAAVEAALATVALADSSGDQ